MTTATSAKIKAANAREKVDLKSLNFDINYANPLAVAPIAAAAWENVRGNDDAPFAACTGDFQRQLIFHVTSALTSGPQSGDTYWARTEQEAVKLRDLAAREAEKSEKK